jgi:hypothetical protein
MHPPRLPSFTGLPPSDVAVGGAECEHPTIPAERHALLPADSNVLTGTSLHIDRSFTEDRLTSPAGFTSASDE